MRDGYTSKIEAKFAEYAAIIAENQAKYRVEELPLRPIELWEAIHVQSVELIETQESN